MVRGLSGGFGALCVPGGRVIPGSALLLALLALAWAPPSARAGDSTPVVQPVNQSPAKVESGWTRSDLITAEPAEVAPPQETGPGLPDFFDASTSAADGDFIPGNVTAYPQRVHGKVFFRSDGTNYVCSGTLVNSRRRNLLFTAGHCVYDRNAGSFVSDLIFVPGYEDGSTPLGTFAATSLLTTTGWIENGDYSYDIAAVPLAGTPEVDLGSRKIAFDLSPRGRSFTIYGYPAGPSPPYDGESLVGCQVKAIGRDAGDPPTIAAGPCDMGKGSSGGGWITDGKYLNSVVSYGYCESQPDLCGETFGPYFSNAAKALYTNSSIGGSARPTVKFKSTPPKKVRKRKVRFRLGGSGSTPVSFRCRLDRRPFVDCSSRVAISRLSPGGHILRVRSIDQTDRQSPETIKRRFRVLRKR